MTKKNKGLTDEEVASLVSKRLDWAKTPGGSKLAEERATGLRYYNGELPLPMHAGDSRFVSQDVFEAIEGAKAVLLEGFSAGRRPVEFTPNTPDDIEAARIHTEYCSQVILADNPGLELMNTTIMDGLLARVGITKSYWKDDKDRVEEEFTIDTPDDLEAILADPGSEIDEDSIEFVRDKATGTERIKGCVYKTVDRSRTVIENIKPEDFRIATGAKSIDRAKFVGDRSRKSKSELLALGLTEKQIDEYGIRFEPAPQFDPEQQVRSREVSDDGTNEQDEDTAEVWDCYVREDLDKSGRARLWNVVMVRGANSKAGIITRKQVRDTPYNVFTPIPLPHSFYGGSYSKRVQQTQAAMTVLIRSIINHTLITNNPRWMVVKGALRTPKELMENRLGGVVNVDRPDGVLPLPQANLNPFVFELLRSLDQKKEDTTGISRLSQGLNKDAISKQNSAAMVEQLASMSMQRTKIVGRQFGVFLKSLYLTVNRIIVDHESSDRIINVAGNFVEVKRETWKDRQHCNVDLTLGYGEMDKEFQQMLGLYQFLAGDPAIGGMFGPEQRYNLIVSALKKIGRVDHANWLLNPKDVQPPQPSPMEQLQLQMLQAQVEAQSTSTQLSVKKTDSQIKLDAMKAQLDGFKARSTHAVQADQVDLKEAELTHKKEIDFAELAFMAKADKTTAIASPDA
jgi:hypothetical protein